MENTIRNVRSYMKTTVIQVPETPEYITRLLSSESAPNSLLLSSQDRVQESSPTLLLSPLLGSPFHELGYLGGSSSQPRMIQSPQDDAEKLASKFRRMEELLKNSGFDSVGELLKILFYNPSRTSGESDPRGTFHAKAIARFLQGRNKVKMSDIITLIYTSTSTVHLRRAHHVILNATLHFQLLSLPLKSVMPVLRYSPGQQILWLITLAVGYMG